MPDPDIKPQIPHPDHWARDLNPDFMAGQNMSQAGPHREFDAPSAFDVKEVHRHLAGFTDDELKGIPILPEGTRLEQGAVYVDLGQDDPQEFKALGNMVAGPGQYLVPKSEVDYRLWNRLIGVTDPNRLEGRRAS